MRRQRPSCKSCPRVGEKSPRLWQYVSQKGYNHHWPNCLMPGGFRRKDSMAASDGKRDWQQDEVRRRGRRALFRRIAVLVGFGLGLVGSAAAAVASDLDLGEAEQLYHTGHYDECARMAAGEIVRGFWSELGPLEDPVRAGGRQVGGRPGLTRRRRAPLSRKYCTPLVGPRPLSRDRA